MIFKNPEELVEFFNNLDLDKSSLVFKNQEEEVVEEQKDCACGGHGTCQCSAPVEESVAEFMEADDKKSLQEFVANFVGNEEEVLIESFSDSPSIKLRLSETGTDTFYVKDYEGIEDACGTGRIELADRTAHMNMCEQSGVAEVTLNLVIEGHRLNNVRVVLAKTENEPYIVLSKDHFKS